MAVVNKYVNTNIADDKKATAAFSEGGRTFTIPVTFEVAAGDDDGSVYRLLRAVNPHLIPIKFEFLNDAITGATDYEVGLYETTTDSTTGVAIDIDVFMGTQDINGGNARGSELNALSAVDVADVQKRIWELAGDAQKDIRIGYDIAVTANTVGSAAGTISLLMTFTQG